MATPIPAEEVETLVGIQRHARDHFLRADSQYAKTYLLHSVECLDAMGLPSADCLFTAAQEQGIDEVASEWEGCHDQPIKVEVDDDGFLVPLYPVD